MADCVLETVRNVSVHCTKCNRKDVIAIRYQVFDNGDLKTHASYRCACGSETFKGFIPPDIVEKINKVCFSSGKYLKEGDKPNEDAIPDGRLALRRPEGSG